MHYVGGCENDLRARSIRCEANESKVASACLVSEYVTRFEGHGRTYGGCDELLSDSIPNVEPIKDEGCGMPPRAGSATRTPLWIGMGAAHR